MFIKSLTHPKTTLSIKFPSVHDSRKEKTIRFILDFLYNINNAIAAKILMKITMYKCTGKDQDIHRLKEGLIKFKFDRKPLS
jgi:hypothetical protein